MPLLDRNVVRGYLAADDELPAAVAWAEVHALEHSWNESELTFELRLTGGGDPNTAEAYLLQGGFDDYRVLPPAWRFLDPRDAADIGPPAYPQAGAFPGGSVLQTTGMICAPWNRLAYASGPHPEWGDAAAWQTIAREYTQADRIPDMLARLLAEVKLSPGRQAPLPDIAEAA